eukprot:SAG31_NODE_25986_length_450_cov_1.247863_2_plen_22_part_01
MALMQGDEEHTGGDEEHSQSLQ